MLTPVRRHYAVSCGPQDCLSKPVLRVGHSPQNLELRVVCREQAGTPKSFEGACGQEGRETLFASLHRGSATEESRDMSGFWERSAQRGVHGGIRKGLRHVQWEHYTLACFGEPRAIGEFLLADIATWSCPRQDLPTIERTTQDKRHRERKKEEKPR